jgi:hypothetical protein
MAIRRQEARAVSYGCRSTPSRVLRREGLFNELGDAEIEQAAFEPIVTQTGLGSVRLRGCDTCWMTSVDGASSFRKTLSFGCFEPSLRPRGVRRKRL